MKTFKKLLTLSIFLVVLTTIFSCKKDNDTNSHEIQFRVTTSANASISTVVHTNVKGEANNLTNINSNNWSATVAIRSSVKSITLSATGAAADASGSMTVQILSNGSVVSQSTVSGQVLSATTTYTVVN